MAIVFERTKGLTDKPFHFCPGCTHGIIHRIIAEVMCEMGILEDTIGVSSVGCTYNNYEYFACDMVQAAHGRAPAVATGIKRNEGIGVIEAPRGTLFHHYQVDENDIVTKANLIVSTTSNNMGMNESVRQVAAEYLSGQELTEPLLNNLEVAIRAYDPCLSCATHAVGKMPLQLELVNAQGEMIDKLVKHDTGKIERVES